MLAHIKTALFVYDFSRDCWEQLKKQTLARAGCSLNCDWSFVWLKGDCSSFQLYQALECLGRARVVPWDPFKSLFPGGVHSCMLRFNQGVCWASVGRCCEDEHLQTDTHSCFYKEVILPRCSSWCHIWKLCRKWRWRREVFDTDQTLQPTSIDCNEI